MGPIVFHLAFPVHNLGTAKQFYVDGLGCSLGRESNSAMTLQLGGHQIVAQLCSRPLERQKGIYPRHFGLIFTVEQDWHTCVERVKTNGLTFYQQPRVRYAGTRIEHRTFFLEDPSHNLLEFKHYTYESAIFGEHEYVEVGDKDEPR